MKNYKQLLALAAVTVFTFGTANATLSVNINDGVDHLITDNGAGDLSADIGSIVNLPLMMNWGLNMMQMIQRI